MLFVLTLGDGRRVCSYICCVAVRRMLISCCPLPLFANTSRKRFLTHSLNTQQYTDIQPCTGTCNHIQPYVAIYTHIYSHMWAHAAVYNHIYNHLQPYNIFSRKAIPKPNPNQPPDAPRNILKIRLDVDKYIFVDLG